ncbi:uncharacterized protein NH340_JMT00434 [Sarcoptes scabiei]|nr:uncharacterized protein NH340_JMT00434 [Sarcoptes scabiei]
MSNWFINQTKTNLIYTACIFFNHFAFGITSNSLWATLVDLTYIYDVPQETINFIGTFASFGYLIGSLSGNLYKWINRQLFLIGMILCISITIVFVPYYSLYQLLFFGVTLNGIAGGSWDSSNNLWLVEMWPEHHASILSGVQFMYGLGTIVSPSLMSPYVSGLNTNKSTVTPIERRSRLTTPFVIVSIIQSIAPIVLFILFVSNRYQRPKSRIENSFEQSSSDSRIIDTTINSDETIQENLVDQNYHGRISKTYRRSKLLLIALFLGVYDAAEIGYFYYSPTMFQFFEIQPKIQAVDAAHLLAILSASYTFGRFFTAFIALKLKPDLILSYHLTIIIIAQIGLFLGRHNQMIIFLSTMIQGFGFSAMWPTIISFTEYHMKLTDRISSLLFFFAGLMTIFTPMIIGPFLETWPLVLFLFEATYLTISVLLFVAIKLFLHFTD